MPEKILAVVKLPGLKPAVAMVDGSLEGLQRFVGGYIETVTFAEDCVVVCNEEGRLLGMKKNMRFLGVEFCGPVLFLRREAEELAGLSEESAERILGMLRGK